MEDMKQWFGMTDFPGDLLLTKSETQFGKMTLVAPPLRDLLVRSHQGTLFPGSQEALRVINAGVRVVQNDLKRKGPPPAR